MPLANPAPVQIETKNIRGVAVRIERHYSYGGWTRYWIGNELVAKISHTGNGYDRCNVYANGVTVWSYDGFRGASPPLKNSCNTVEAVIERLIGSRDIYGS